MDEQTNPVCSLGGDRGKPDHMWPNEHCCRVYELKNWHGKYMDFCTVDGKGKKYELLDQWGKSNWNDEISSFKCGSKVAIRMCSDPDCDPYEP